MASSNASADTSPTRNITSDIPPEDEDREAPVREKLEETSIEEQKKRVSIELADADMKEVPGQTDGRGRIRKKRSFDDIGDSETSGTTKHVRKRSRDSETTHTVEEGNAVSEAPRPESHTNGNTSAADPEKVPPTPQENSEASATGPSDHLKLNESTEEDKKPEVTSQIESDEAQAQPAPQIPDTSGFGNTSTKSPFASLGANKSPFSNNGPTTSGFASSGFTSYSTSSKSQFGSLSSSNITKQNTTDPKSPEATEPPKEKLSFASTGTGLTGFGALANKPSAFSSGNSFKSPFQFTTSKLTSFASSATPENGFASKPLNALGETGEEPDEPANEDFNDVDVATAPVGTGDDIQDERFYEREVETGEEGESSLFQCRAKLFCMQENVWKERGLGTFKLNAAHVRDEDFKPDSGDPNSTRGEQREGDTTPEHEPQNKGDTAEATENDTMQSLGKAKASTLKARFIFRTDASYRMMLNSPITKDVELQDRSGGPPKSKNAIFTGFVDGKPAPCLIQVRKSLQIRPFLSLHY